MLHVAFVSFDHHFVPGPNLSWRIELKRSSPQAKTSKRCPRFRALVFSPKLDPSQIWKVLIFTNLLNLRSCRPNKNRKKWYVKISSIFTSWWFQPIWKILVKLDHFPRYCLLHTATKPLEFSGADWQDLDLMRQELCLQWERTDFFSLMRLKQLR